MIKLLERDAALATVRAFVRRGGVLVIEGGAGVGKTAILDAACVLAQRKGRLVLRARGSDLETDFAFGIVCQLFERRCTQATRDEQAELFRGAAAAARALVMHQDSGGAKQDTSFAVVHGVYWLAVDLGSCRPVLLAVDDGHWGDDASLRCLAYLAARLEGSDVSLAVTLRPEELRSARALLTVRATASATVHPALLSERAVAAIARRTLGTSADGDMCAGIHHATGGNPFYVLELLRALKRADHPSGARAIEDAISRGGLGGIAMQLGVRLRSLDPRALTLAQAMAILGDGCELRHAAAISRLDMSLALHFAAELVRLDVLGTNRPPRFIHPIVRQAVIETLSSAEHDAAQRAAAGVLYAERSPPGRIAAHVSRLRPAGDSWIVERLREGARAALENGAPAAAADLLERALAEPPASELRGAVLREAARAHLRAGRALACKRLEEAMSIAESRLQTELASELAQSYATLFRWTDAVDVLERALKLLGTTRRSFASHLQSQLIAAGLQDARVAPRASQVMARMARCRLSGPPAVALGVAQGMVAILTGQPAGAAALLLERALAGIGVETGDHPFACSLARRSIPLFKSGLPSGILRRRPAGRAS